ncbi:MAG: peptidoglycan DD-metalloendopeptidase family protein [Candidatus Doudnabacteria bacterium]|nr:peptidoglycan DD-metalloendopeptidase family protein [Candidatus Doudnabacteria bacterium]
MNSLRLPNNSTPDRTKQFRRASQKAGWSSAANAYLNLQANPVATRDVTSEWRLGHSLRVFKDRSAMGLHPRPSGNGINTDRAKSRHAWGSKMRSMRQIAVRLLKRVTGTIQLSRFTTGFITRTGYLRPHLVQLKPKDSFSSWKKNFFKFGLELNIALLILFTVSMNGRLTKVEKTDTPKSRFLTYLVAHPGYNPLMIDKIGTENITLDPEASFINKVQAASLDPLTTGGAAELVKAGPSQPKNELLLVSADSVITKPNLATRDAGKNRDIQDYLVKTGDSVSQIASTFGVSVQTVMYENKIADGDYIQPGQVLKILPTTGIKHTIRAGETISSIAKKYQVEEEVILEFNQIEIPDDIETGEILIIPEGRIQLPPARQSQIASLNRVDIKQAQIPADFVGGAGDLLWPLSVHNVTQRFSSRHKGVDISNGQRPQFWAAQTGIVELSGWQAGYGKTIVINHGNGVQTRYAHASELYVTAGDRVEHGQTIGRVGNTGRVYGRTGNHLHFEVIKNGSKIDPEKFVDDD